MPHWVLDFAIRDFVFFWDLCIFFRIFAIFGIPRFLCFIFLDSDVPRLRRFDVLMFCGFAGAACGIPRF